MNNDKNITLPNGKSPYNHQIEGAVICAKQNTILSYDAGLGKTLTSLMAARIWQAKTGHKRVVIVAPPTVKINWEHEAEGLIDKSDLRVFSYGSIPAPIPGDPFMLILDEGHVYQSWYSERTKKAVRLAEVADRVIILTATPIRNYSSNLFPLLNMIKRYDVAADYQAYLRQYCNGKPNENSNTAELYHRIKNSILVKRKDILDLPKLHSKPLTVNFTGQARANFEKIYRDMRDEYRQKIASGESTGKMQYLVLLQKLRQASSLAKVPFAVKLAKKYLDRGKQVIIFTNFLNTIEKLSEGLERYPKEILTGSDTHKQRQNKADRFQAGKSTLWLATIAASGVGVNLFKGTIVIFVDRTFSPSDMEQAWSRAHRIGVQEDVYVFALVDTISDPWVDGITMHKYRVISHLLDGRPEEFEQLKGSIDYRHEILEHVF